MKQRIVNGFAALLPVAMVILATSPVRAQDAPATEPAKPAEPAKPGVTAKLVPELGLIIVGGNTKTTSINSAATGNVTAGNASIDAYFKSLFSKSRVYDATTHLPKTDVTAEKYEMGTKPAYNVSDRVYVFGTLDYVDDKFSGFDWVVTETGGLGAKLINEKDMTLKFEGGPGGKHTRTLPVAGPPPVAQIRNDDFIGRGAISFLWKITDTSSLGEEANTIFGPKATGGIVTDATTSLTSQIIGKLSLKATFNIKYTTKPPQVDPDGDGTPQQAKDIDTKTALNFVYTVNWDDVSGLK